MPKFQTIKPGRSPQAANLTRRTRISRSRLCVSAISQADRIRAIPSIFSLGECNREYDGNNRYV